MAETDCALCGRADAPHFHRIATYSGTPGNRPDGEWLCWGENESNSREAWACYYRYQVKAKKEKRNG